MASDMPCLEWVARNYHHPQKRAMSLVDSGSWSARKDHIQGDLRTGGQPLGFVSPLAVKFPKAVPVELLLFTRRNCTEDEGRLWDPGLQLLGG